MKRIDLDSNATTPLDPRVLEAMTPYLGGEAGNPSSVHAGGRRARAAVLEARRALAAALGARVAPEEIVFTSGGTEADNLALIGIARGRAARGAAPHVLVSAVEHPAVLEAAASLERDGFRISRVAVDARGIVDPDRLAGELRDDTALVSIMAANNEVGALQPLAEISRACRERGIPLHTDAVQAAGRIPIDVDTPHVDALSLSAHKIHGPLGAGALFVRKGTPLEPLLHGGGQEGGRRAGTENVPGVVGLARAVEIAASRLPGDSSRMRTLSARLLERLREAPGGVHLNGPADPRDRLPNTLGLSFEDTDSEALVVSLDLAGVAVSAGSACSSGALEVSHVLAAMGLPRERLRCAVRISLGRDTTAEAIDRAASIIDDVVRRIRRVRDVSDPTQRGEKISYRFP